MKSGEDDRDSLESIMVFAFMVFGAEAEKWDPELLFYRTGIALGYYKKGIGTRRI